MDPRINSILFGLLRSGIRGESLTEAERSRFSPELLPQLLTISQKHDIGHLIGLALDNNSLLSKGDGASDPFFKETLKAVYRHQRLDHELQLLCHSLEEAQIPHIPLKGSVLRKYYPEPWMRTSCDIDILIHPEDLSRATTLLTDVRGFTLTGKNSHDVSFYTPWGNHLELHYDLIENGRIHASREVLKEVWDTSVPQSGFRYRREMTDEMFYFYHIAHMAKHFENGGCGIRPFIDLWILDRMPDVQQQRDALLERGGLTKFAESCRRLCGIWFDGHPADEISLKMADFILSGGVYGTSANFVVVQQQKKGGRLKYALSRIFLSRKSLAYSYPILDRHPWLLPVMQVRRWFRILFNGRLKRSVRELQINQKISKDEAAHIVQLLEDIGL